MCVSYSITVFIVKIIFKKLLFYNRFVLVIWDDWNLIRTSSCKYNYLLKIGKLKVLLHSKGQLGSIWVPKNRVPRVCSRDFLGNPWFYQDFSRQNRFPGNFLGIPGFWRFPGILFPGKWNLREICKPYNWVKVKCVIYCSLVSRLLLIGKKSTASIIVYESFSNSQEFTHCVSYYICINY